MNESLFIHNKYHVTGISTQSVLEDYNLPVAASNLWTNFHNSKDINFKGSGWSLEMGGKFMFGMIGGLVMGL